MAAPTAAPIRAHDPWAPFHHRVYLVIWIATVVSNVGSWMYNAAAAWLMTSLSADPMMVSLVQVASNLPIFLFALPAGAIADVVDRRKFLLIAETSYAAVAVVFAFLVTSNLVTPAILLAFVFVLGAGTAIMAPPYQSIVPILVPRHDLAPAVAANSVGMNISRAVGPALGGIITAVAGIAAPFWVNAFSNMGTIGALWWWKPPARPVSPLPSERLFGAMRTGVRYARFNAALRATFARSVAFFIFASAYWALLPLVARDQIAGGADLYGILLGAIGAGAIGAAFTLPRLRHALGPDRVVAFGSAGTALSLVLFGLSRNSATAAIASVIAGASWIAVLTSLNVSAQVALPEWVRSRGLAVYVAVFFGSMTLGSVIWGQVARVAGLPVTHYIAAVGILVAIPLTWRWKLHKGEGVDLTPSMHWPTPMISTAVPDDAGPVMVTIEYEVEPRNRDAFLEAIQHQAAERRRDGAYWWGVFEDIEHAGRFVESFHVESWIEHKRQHGRVTRADRDVEARVRQFAVSEPRVRHMIAAVASASPNREKVNEFRNKSSQEVIVSTVAAPTKAPFEQLSSLLPELEALYKDIHSHPELSMQETRTAALAAERLRAAGFEVTTGVGKTGVVGLLRNGDGPTVMMRADMDALPVEEATGLPYASKVKAKDRDGNTVPVMHACGHDMHVAWLVGATTLLSRTRDSWKGTAMAVFQPAEETAEGAQAMIDDGLFKRFPKPDVVLGQHVMVGPAGNIGGRSGVVTSAADSLQIRLFGRGAHGSMPQASIDPVVMAAATVMRLQTIVSRELAATDAAVVTIGSLQAGTKENVIPDEAVIKLNVRTFDEGVRKRVLAAIERIVNAEAAASGAPRPPEITPLDRYSLTMNDAGASDRIAKAFREQFTGKRVVHTAPTSASEDFGSFGAEWHVPSVFWFVGGTDPQVYAKAKEAGKVQDIPTNHNPRFAPVLHPTLEAGVEAMVTAARAWLAQ